MAPSVDLRTPPPTSDGWSDLLEYDASGFSQTFPFTKVLALYQAGGRGQVDPQFAQTLSEIPTDESPTLEVADAHWLLQRWLPMLIDVQSGNASYHTYVGTGIIEDLIGVDPAAFGSAKQLAARLLSDLLLVESSSIEGTETRFTGRTPSASDLLRRVHAIRVALREFDASFSDSEQDIAKALAVLFQAPMAHRRVIDCILLPITNIHDEVMFLRVLQVFECIFTAAYSLLRLGRNALLAGDVESAATSFRDAAVALDLGIPVFRVLATIDRNSFALIREQTTGSSGLQSTSFKRIELICATPGKDRLASPAFSTDEVAALVGVDEPTIESALRGNRMAYRDERILRALVAVDQRWLRWKRTHWAVANRVIGSVPGSGGTVGTSYLREHMLAPLFPNLHREELRSEIALPLGISLGPAESALAAAISEISPSAGQVPFVIQSRRRKLGDFKLDVRTILPPDATADQTACAGLAAQASELAEVDRAVAVPPRVYLTTSLETLRTSVVSAILRSRRTYGTVDPPRRAAVQVQFSCPNLNKALHLGHLRNNFLGAAIANIAEACGYEVVRVDQPSSWGNHIAKALLAYTKWGNERTPERDGVKPDHFVEDFYAEFARRRDEPGGEVLDRELADLVRRSESGDPALVALTQRLIGWAYRGIRETYGRIDSRFDVVSPEGETLSLAQTLIERRVGDVAVRRADNSVFVDLTDRGLREVTVLRQDGTPLLPVQFIGACIRRHQLDSQTTLLFVMGLEYKDAVPELLGTLDALGYSELASHIEAVYHGMLYRGTEKMSSRAGTVVKADDLLNAIAARIAEDWESELDGPLDWFQSHVCETLSVALVKYHFLSVPRLRRMPWKEESLWNESLPRLANLLWCLKLGEGRIGDRGYRPPVGKPAECFRTLLLHLNRFPKLASDALERRDPAEIVRYSDELCDLCETCTRDKSVDDEMREAISVILRRCLKLLNIALPPFLTMVPRMFSRSAVGSSQQMKPGLKIAGCYPIGVEEVGTSTRGGP